MTMRWIALRSSRQTNFWRFTFLFFLLAIVARPVAADGAFQINIDGAIGPAVADHVTRGFEEAARQDADVIILRIDTPGGLVSSTRDIIKVILASKRPVVGFVAPSGARAASAGAYILLSCHVAVMAPGTNVGSATPVAMGGGTPGGTPASQGDKDYPGLTDKIINDARAYIRAIAEMRGRPADAAEAFVSEAENLTAAEALERSLIDTIATGRRDMLSKIDGMQVQLGSETRTLATSQLDITPFETSWRDDFLAFITNPNIAYLMLMVGVYGLIIEASNPGLAIPGIAGGICLIIGLYALQMLPVNYAGLALILLGIALMAAEAFVPAFGALGFGGIAAFIFGSIMLFDSDVPELSISPWLIGTVSLATAGLFLFFFAFAVKAWRRPAVSGNDGLIGTAVPVLSWTGKHGTVRALGEVWQAEGPEELTVGAHVTVKAVRGLTVIIGADTQTTKTQGKEIDNVH